MNEQITRCRNARGSRDGILKGMYRLQPSANPKPTQGTPSAAARSSTSSSLSEAVEKYDSPPRRSVTSYQESVSDGNGCDLDSDPAPTARALCYRVRSTCVISRRLTPEGLRTHRSLEAAAVRALGTDGFCLTIARGSSRFLEVDGVRRAAALAISPGGQIDRNRFRAMKDFGITPRAESR